MSAGLGRPLVLTTLEPSEAMRILTGGDRRRPLVAVVCLAGGLALIAVALLLAVGRGRRVTRRRVGDRRGDRCGDRRLLARHRDDDTGGVAEPGGRRPATRAAPGRGPASSAIRCSPCWPSS